MGIETTINIRDDLLEKLDKAAGNKGITRSRLISILLVKYMKNQQAGGKVFTRLKNQDRDPSVKYRRKNIYLREDIYEMWCDVRKAFKLSAAHLIARAIDQYLEKIVETNLQPDNNFNMYVSRFTYSDKTTIISIIWGYPGPEKLAKHYAT